MTFDKEMVWIGAGARAKDYVNERRELRTITIHTCGICGTRTNLWGVYYFMGYPSLRLVCPYRNDLCGNEINKQHVKLQAFQERLHDIAVTAREVEEINAEIRQLKDFFKSLRDDVVKY